MACKSKIDTRLQKQHNRMLMDENPYLGIDEKSDMHLGRVIDLVQAHIEGCLGLDQNPLEHLKKYFPEMEWKLNDNLRSLRQIIQIIKTNDFSWMVQARTYYRQEFPTRIVTARAKKKEGQQKNPRKFAVVPQSQGRDSYEMMHWPNHKMGGHEINLIKNNPKWDSNAQVGIDRIS